MMTGLYWTEAWNLDSKAPFDQLADRLSFEATVKIGVTTHLAGSGFTGHVDSRRAQIRGLHHLDLELFPTKVICHKKAYIGR